MADPAQPPFPADQGAGPPAAVARVHALVRELLRFEPEQIEAAIAWLVTHRPEDGGNVVFVLDGVLEQVVAPEDWLLDQQPLPPGDQ
jgi:hypothetical protein